MLGPDGPTLGLHLGGLVSGPNTVEGVFGLLALVVAGVGHLDMLLPARLQEKGDVVEVIDSLLEDETIGGGEELELDSVDEDWKGYESELEDFLERRALGQMHSLQKWGNQCRAMREDGKMEGNTDL